jgi:hypothetical protein
MKVVITDYEYLRGQIRAIRTYDCPKLAIGVNTEDKEIKNGWVCFALSREELLDLQKVVDECVVEWEVE